MEINDLCKRCGYQESEHEKARNIYYGIKGHSLMSKPCRFEKLRKEYPRICRSFVSPISAEKFRINENMFYFSEDITK